MSTTFAELKARAARQFGYDADDLPELEPDVSAYTNEGYQHLMLERYRPWREDAFPHADLLPQGEGCALPMAQLSHQPLRILQARIGGMPTTALLDEAQSLILLPGLPPLPSPMLYTEEAIIDPAAEHHMDLRVRYTYRPRPLAEDDDLPKLPFWTHTALADWATWRLYMNGNSQKQHRGLAYRAAYDEVFRRLKPFGEGLSGYSQFHSLYTPNRLGGDRP